MLNQSNQANMSAFQELMKQFKAEVQRIDNQQDFQNEPNILNALKSEFRNNCVEENSEFVFQWRFRHLSRDANELYSSDHEDQFDNVCDQTINHFKKIADGKGTFYISKSHEYGQLTLRVPKSLDLVAEKKEFLKKALINRNIPVVEMDIVANVTDNYVAMKFCVSEEFLARLEQVMVLFGFSPVRHKAHDGILLKFIK